MKISVVIPYYNGKKYIYKAIESCHSNDMEIIVVDDNAPDPFSYEGQQPVKIIRLAKNVGQGMARNAGLDAASGDWITFLDQDDEFLIDLDVFLKLIPKESQAVWTQTIYVTQEGEQKIYNENLSLVHGKFYRRQWLIDNDIRFSESCRYYEDIYFCNLLIPYLEADECARMEIPTYVWYQNPEQQTANGDYDYEHLDCMIKSNFDIYIRHYRRKLLSPEQASFCIRAATKQAITIIEKHNGEKDYPEKVCLLDNALKKAAKAGIKFM